VVDINLPRDKETGKTKGFGFLMYEDQRSTILAVDNLNGANVLDRTLRVDHVKKYKQARVKGEDGEWKDGEEQSLNAKPEMIGEVLTLPHFLTRLHILQTMAPRNRPHRPLPISIPTILCETTCWRNGGKNELRREGRKRKRIKGERMRRRKRDGQGRNGSERKGRSVKPVNPRV
jgi:RNA recognition motif-containing protein